MADDGAELIEELMRFKPDGLTPNAWAVQAGVGRTIWADLRRHGNPSRRTLSKLLEAAGSSLAEFEALRVGRPSVEEPTVALADPRRSWGHAPIAPLPLFSTRPGGVWGDEGQGVELVLIDRGELLDRLSRPPSLAADRNAYAVTVMGESMWPRFRQGRHVAVSPAALVSAGDDVLVILADGRRALIGELQSRDRDRLTLRQYNPSVEFSVAAAEAQAAHKILGELI